jgi:hypothetical protein
VLEAFKQECDEGNHSADLNRRGGPVQVVGNLGSGTA